MRGPLLQPIFQPIMRPIVRAVLGASRGGRYNGPSLALRFGENQYLMGAIGKKPAAYQPDGLITFTRSTKAWEWDWQGNYSEVAEGVMRIAHDPLTKSTSTTPQTLGTGSYTFAVTYQYPIGKAVRVSADAANWMVGRVTASSPTSVTIFVSAPPVGAGTYSAWTLIVRLGIRVEEQRANLLKNSKLVGGTAGTVGGGAVIPGWWNAPLTGGAIAFPVTPFGPTGIAFSKPVGTDRPFIQQSIGVSAGTSYTLSTRVVEASGTLKLFDVCAFASLPAGSTVAFFKNGVLGAATGTTELAIGDVISCVATIGATAGTLQARVGLGAAGDPSVTGTCTLTMPQVEVGATYSSNIPTGDSQVIRAADFPLVNTLAPWFNPLEWTIVVAAVFNDAVGNILALVGIDDATTSNRFNIRCNAPAGRGEANTVTAGVAVSSLATPAGSLLPGARGVIASSVKAESFALSANGGAVLTDTSGAVPPVTRMTIGTALNSTALNGIIEDIIYHPRVQDTQQASA